MTTIIDLLFGVPPSWYDRPLYISQDNRTTFGQTRQTMLQVAEWLIKQHAVGVGNQVALCLPMGMTAAHITLGVLAAGASYLPLQLYGPPDRLTEILTSSNCQLLITTTAMANKLGEVASSKGPIKLLLIDQDFAAFTATLNGLVGLQNPVPSPADQLAAIFFTSGSTGQPKGIMMSRRSLTETTYSLPRGMPLNQDDIVLMAAPLHYAASLALFYPFSIGCRAYIAGEDEAMFAEIAAEILEREGITVWDGPASRLRHVVTSGELAGRDLSAMRRINTFGEPMTIENLRAAKQYFPNAIFQNTYASSEAFWITTFVVSGNLLEELDTLPIGKPLPCYELGLYDEAGNIVAPGDVGEICVIGSVSIIGYWNRDDLTQASRLKAIPNSYRTGDLARLGPDGNYYLVGRRDHQIKIRGHRFHLGEIEAALKSHPSVREAVACMVDEEILACVLAADYNNLVGEISSICVKRLPNFARPKNVIVLPEFPRLSSGKIDRIGLTKTLSAK